MVPFGGAAATGDGGGERLGVELGSSRSTPDASRIDPRIPQCGPSSAYIGPQSTPDRPQIGPRITPCGHRSAPGRPQIGPRSTMVVALGTSGGPREGRSGVGREEGPEVRRRWLTPTSPGIGLTRLGLRRPPVPPAPFDMPNIGPSASSGAGRTPNPSGRFSPNSGRPPSGLRARVCTGGEAQAGPNTMSTKGQDSAEFEIGSVEIHRSRSHSGQIRSNSSNFGQPRPNFNGIRRRFGQARPAMFQLRPILFMTLDAALSTSYGGRRGPNTTCFCTEHPRGPRRPSLSVAV